MASPARQFILDLPTKRVEEYPPAVLLEEWENILISDTWVAEERRDALRHEFWQTLGVYCYGKVVRSLWKPLALMLFAGLCFASLGKFMPDITTPLGVGFAVASIFASGITGLWGLLDFIVSVSRLYSKRISSLYWSVWVQHHHSDGLYIALGSSSFLVTAITLLIA